MNVSAMARGRKLQRLTVALERLAVSAAAMQQPPQMKKELRVKRVVFNSSLNISKRVRQFGPRNDCQSKISFCDGDPAVGLGMFDFTQSTALLTGVFKSTYSLKQLRTLMRRTSQTRRGFSV